MQNISKYKYNTVQYTGCSAVCRHLVLVVLFVDTLYGIVSFNKHDKAVPVRNMKAHTEVSVNILLHLLYPWFPFNRRLGGFQSWYGHFAEQKNLSLARNQTPDLPARG